MLNLDRIQKNERLMKAVFGLSIKQFNELVEVFDRNYDQAIDAQRAARGCVWNLEVTDDLAIVLIAAVISF